MLEIIDLQKELSFRLDNAVVSMDKNPLSESFLGEVLGAIESLGFVIIPTPQSPSATALDGLAESIARNSVVTVVADTADVVPGDINTQQILFELRNAGWVLIPPAI
ncbi:MAG: hypothetical protein WC979_09285 [Candidatus Pacearchaeota archaeon]|jgi:hypothetical protein